MPDVTQPPDIAQAGSNIRRWREQPGVMVRELFKTEPDLWQDDALQSFPHSPRMAMQACTGPGKTAVLAWLGWNFMLTRPHARVGATSISGDNLKSNLWTELGRWYERCPLLKSAFEMTKTEIFARDHPKTWKLDARTWAKDADATQIGSALRGIHGAYVMWLLDESGDYPDSILPVCENIFSGNPSEAHIVQAGNPLKLSGPLYRACTVARHLWKVIEITADPDDPRRTPRVSIEHAREQIRQYGRDNPWVLVNIFGKFPPASINALIGPDEVSASMKRYYRPHEIGYTAPKVLGVDVAREGDDKSVICKRHGLQMFPLLAYRNIDSVVGAGATAREWNDFGADGCFIDATGGFGSGWLDQLRLLGKQPIGVHFSGEAHQKDRYFNKRAEMAFDLVEWIRRGGALPESPELLAGLTQTTYTFRGDRLILEPKDDIKIKLGYSPDEMDACMLTFAEPVGAVNSLRRPSSQVSAVSPAYDEFAEMDIERTVSRSYGARHRSDYDPYSGT